jgi:ABC-type phosphate transport system substrate-binding protein
MTRNKLSVVAILFAAILAATLPAMAQTVEVVGAGSSAMWQGAAYAAWHDLAGATAGTHYTVKGSCTSGNCAQLKDQRSSSIALEGGNLWVVWNSAQTEVWAYLSVDSVVGNRCYRATPRCLLQIDSETENTTGTVVPASQTNLISSGLWGADATALPTAVYTALNGAPVTAAFTDIRPEDAKFAQCRTSSALNTTNYSGLGYGSSCTQLVATAPIKSNFSSSVANPVAFNLSGVDPFNGDPIPASTTIPVGAAPIIFIANQTDATGLGSASVTNVTVNSSGTGTAQGLWENKAACNATTLGGGSAPVTVLLREPMSGTMNTTEFTNFRLVGSGLGSASQENDINPTLGSGAPGASNNPLNLTCASGGGSRQRVIGTGEMVKEVGKIADSIGYVFFSYGNVASIAPTTAVPAGIGKYLTLNGVDPIQATYTNGELPTCTAPCPVAAGKSFPNLRNGTYRAWSLLRVTTNATGTNFTHVSALVTALQNDVNSTVPDFVPYKTTNGSDPGFSTELYRSHYLQSGVSPNNGLSGQTEAGGDVGGCIEKVAAAPGILSCHQ